MAGRHGCLRQGEIKYICANAPVWFWAIFMFTLVAIGLIFAGGIHSVNTDAAESKAHALFGAGAGLGVCTFFTGLGLTYYNYKLVPGKFRKSIGGIIIFWLGLICFVGFALCLWNGGDLRFLGCALCFIGGVVSLGVSTLFISRNLAEFDSEQRERELAREAQVRYEEEQERKRLQQEEETAQKKKRDHAKWIKTKLRKGSKVQVYHHDRWDKKCYRVTEVKTKDSTKVQVRVSYTTSMAGMKLNKYDEVQLIDHKGRNHGGTLLGEGRKGYKVDVGDSEKKEDIRHIPRGKIKSITILSRLFPLTLDKIQPWTKPKIGTERRLAEDNVDSLTIIAALSLFILCVYAIYQYEARKSQREWERIHNRSAGQLS